MAPYIFLWLRKGQTPAENVKEVEKFLKPGGNVRKVKIKGSWQGIIYAAGDSALKESNGLVSYWAQEGTGITRNTPLLPSTLPTLLRSLERCEGFWVALEIDPKTSRIRLARDRLAGMPLYSYRDKGNLILSSDIKATRAALPGKFPISYSRIAGFLSSLLPPYYALETLFEGISRPESGMVHTFDLNKGTVESETYLEPFTKPPLWVPPSAETLKGWTSRLRELLRETLVRNLGGVRNLAFELSGGVDSSVLAVELKRSGIPFRTTSVTYPECKG